MSFYECTDWLKTKLDENISIYFWHTQILKIFYQYLKIGKFKFLMHLILVMLVWSLLKSVLVNGEVGGQYQGVVVELVVAVLRFKQASLDTHLSLSREILVTERLVRDENGLILHLPKELW